MEPVVVLDMAAEGVADGIMEGRLSQGGTTYGRPDLPCELESETLGPNESVGRVADGRMIVMGSKQCPLSKLDIYGSMTSSSYKDALGPLSSF
ncbi:hypothetical protein L1887_27755 [Cichorium endivia]|nr:hypothetical protein L1887_27755 [Cichorium endivia]